MYIGYWTINKYNNNNNNLRISNIHHRFRQDQQICHILVYKYFQKHFLSKRPCWNRAQCYQTCSTHMNLKHSTYIMQTFRRSPVPVVYIKNALLSSVLLKNILDNKIYKLHRLLFLSNLIYPI